MKCERCGYSYQPACGTAPAVAPPRDDFDALAERARDAGWESIEMDIERLDGVDPWCVCLTDNDKRHSLASGSTPTEALRKALEEAGRG